MSKKGTEAKKRGRRITAGRRPDFPHRNLFIDLFGGDVYAVGGYIRDLFRGAETPEIDILIARRRLEDIIAGLEKHGRVDVVGRSFGIIKFAIEGRTYDIALPRRDTALKMNTRSHKDFLIDSDPFMPIEADLKRRDFTINSMALRLTDGQIIDPFGGQKDTAARLIRTTNPRAFPEDPLRVLRAARLASVLDFRIDKAIYEAARKIDLTGLSVERTNDELFKIMLQSKRPSRGLRELFKLGVIGQLYPELSAITLVIQDSTFHPEADEQGHHTVWAHTLLTVDQAAIISTLMSFDQGRRLALLLAALYHDIGKAKATRWDFKHGRMTVTSNGHDIQSEKMTRKIFERQRIYSWHGYDVATVTPLLIRTHHRASELWLNRNEVTKRAFNRLAAEVRGEIGLVVGLDAADRAGRKRRPVQTLDRQARWLLGKFEELRINIETIKPLVMGRHLIELGMVPGPDMGKLLKKLYRLQLDGIFETKAEGLKEAKKLRQRVRK